MGHVGSDYNTQLAPGDPESRKGGPATIEDPVHAKNLCWQTRPAPLTPDEDVLADSLQAIFAQEIYALDGIVEQLNQIVVTLNTSSAHKQLNQMKISPPAGAPTWTEANFRAELRRLGNLTG